MSQANRRSHPRQLRRVQVRVQCQGEDRVQHGFTKNLSLSGALIGLPDPPSRGSRLRLELVGRDQNRVVYGEVVHAHRVPPELRRFAESAMGVRFLDTGEVVAPFLPEGSPHTGAGTGTHAGSASDPRTGAGAPSVERAATETATAETAPVSIPSRSASPGTGPAPGSGAEDSEPPTYSVVFERPADFLETYRRDLVNGGLFVSTSRPVPLHRGVTVALHLPESVGRSFRVRARVVQVVEPRTVAGGRTAGGVGLEILDPDRLLAALRPLVVRLQG